MLKPRLPFVNSAIQIKDVLNFLLDNEDKKLTNYLQNIAGILISSTDELAEQILNHKSFNEFWNGLTTEQLTNIEFVKSSQFWYYCAMNAKVRGVLIDQFKAPIKLYDLHKKSYWPKAEFNKEISKAVVDLIIAISSGNESIESEFA